jgi:hypothetical protein
MGYSSQCISHVFILTKNVLVFHWHYVSMLIYLMITFLMLINLVLNLATNFYAHLNYAHMSLCSFECCCRISGLILC